MRAVLVSNPRATTTTLASRVTLGIALEGEFDLTDIETTYPGHARDIASQYRNSADLIIVHGGDGTVNEVVSGVLGTPDSATSLPAQAADSLPTIAVIPGGSANVFARSIGMHNDPYRAVKQLLICFRAARHSLLSMGLATSFWEDGRTDRRWFICNAGLGIDADVVALMEARRRAGHAVTPTRYLWSALTTYRRWAFTPGPLSLELPDRATTPQVCLAFVSNRTPWTYLGKRPIVTNPGTKADTGLGVFAATKITPWRGVNIALALLRPSVTPDMAGTVRHDNIDSLALNCEYPLRFQVDGEYLGPRVRAEFRSIPSALRIITPHLLPA